jgi:hypothetical protein
MSALKTAPLKIGLVAAALMAAIATPALAEKVGPAAKAFPYLEKFLKVPAGERSRVRLGYALSLDDKPLANLKATLIEANGVRTPLPVSASGAFERLPTLAQLEDGAKLSLDLPEDAKVSTALNFGTQLNPATEYDVRELTATVTEANMVIGKAAGPLSLMAPKMTGISFVKAVGGVAVFADGHTQPLPQIKETPYFRTEDFKGAVRVKLTKSPTKVGFYDRKK